MPAAELTVFLSADLPRTRLVTAAASATVYFFNGAIKPEIAVPLALGILGGAALGSRIMPHLPAKVIRMIFIPILLYLGLQMILKACGVMI